MARRRNPPGAPLHLGGDAYASPDLEPLLVPITDTTPYPGNPRRHDQDNITGSIRDHGLYQGVVVQTSTGHVIVGNGRREALVALGAGKIPAAYLDIPDDRAAAIVARDNRTSDLAWNDPRDLLALISDFDADLLALAGYDDAEVADLLARAAEDTTADLKYTHRTGVPHYQISGLRPDPQDLVDRTRTDELTKAIHDADLPDEVREFLLAGAQRHLVFNYALIAEFYAHAEPEVQRLMEASALVIVDLDDAIFHGYVALSERMREILSMDLTDRAVRIGVLDPDTGDPDA